MGAELQNIATLGCLGIGTLLGGVFMGSQFRPPPGTFMHGLMWALLLFGIGEFVLAVLWAIALGAAKASGY